MRKLFFGFSFLLLILSCTSDPIPKKEILVNQEKDTLVLKFRTLSPVPLNSQAKKEVSDWIEYQNLSEFIPNLFKTDTKQALFDSQRVLELSKQLKDSIRIEKMDIPSFRARLHVLYNESLRLADMDSIKSITPAEVEMQTKNIVNAYDAINSKINMLVSQESLEENLKEFDSILNKKDSTKKDFKPFLKISKIKGKRKIKRIKPIFKNRIPKRESRKKILEKLKKAKQHER